MGIKWRYMAQYSTIETGGRLPPFPDFFFFRPAPSARGSARFRGLCGLSPALSASCRPSSPCRLFLLLPAPSTRRLFLPFAVFACSACFSPSSLALPTLRRFRLLSLPFAGFGGFAAPLPAPLAVRVGQPGWLVAWFWVCL